MRFKNVFYCVLNNIRKVYSQARLILSVDPLVYETCVCFRLHRAPIDSLGNSYNKEPRGTQISNLITMCDKRNTMRVRVIVIRLQKENLSAMICPHPKFHMHAKENITDK